MRTTRRISLGLALAVSAGGAIAHHSIGGEFSNEQVTVEGIVTEYRLVNPHTWIVLEVGQDAATTEWALTLGPATKLIRGFGWTETSLAPGERITATGRAARAGDGMYIVKLVKADGTVLIDELQE